MGNPLRTGQLSRYITRRLHQLSLAISPWRGAVGLSTS